MIKLGILGMILTPIVVWAQDAERPSGELPAWVNYGVLGLVVAAFILKQLVPGWLYSDLKRENDELRTENRRLVDLNLSTQATTAPALAAAAKAMDEMITTTRILKRERGTE